ncbi:MAG: hypothetical protein IJK53_08270 [Erysipelotrichaceae bacterium]|nr:hypothetical protein [Erysipelotrichaceae bacterium]
MLTIANTPEIIKILVEKMDRDIADAITKTLNSEIRDLGYTCFLGANRVLDLLQKGVMYEQEKQNDGQKVHS